jgi:ketosteroid isomerase-like protein
MSTTSAPPSIIVAPTSDAERWVAAFIDGWRAPRGPEQFAAHFRSQLSGEVRLIQPQLPMAVGHRGFEEQFVKPLFALMPDIRGEVERWAARGDHLYIELTLHATLGGRPLSWRVCDRVTLHDGVAIERESYFDPAPLLTALARSPRAWPRFLRVQAGRVANHLRERRSR